MRNKLIMADNPVPILNELNNILKEVNIKITGFFYGKINNYDIENSLILNAINLGTNQEYDILYDDAFDYFITNLAE